jgi:IS5 family transposase
MSAAFYFDAMRKTDITQHAMFSYLGWSKTIGGLRKARFVGLAKVRAQTIFTFAADNLTRMATIFAWRLSTV